MSSIFMTLDLGGKLELSGEEVRNSTKIARRIFLKLVGIIKPDVVFDLLKIINPELLSLEIKEDEKQLGLITKFAFAHTWNEHYYSVDLSKLNLTEKLRDTVVLAYFQFLFQSQKEFDQLYKESECEWNKFTRNPNPELITQTTLKKLVPDWQTLQTNDKATNLCKELREWSEKWNLYDDWCLNFAIDCLRNFKLNIVDKMTIPEDYITNNDNYSLWSIQMKDGEIERIWNNTIIYFDDNDDNDPFFFPVAIEDYPNFSYSWKHKTKNGIKEIFKINEFYNPLTSHPETFRNKVEKQFWENFCGSFYNNPKPLIGSSRKVLKRIEIFLKRVDKHIQNCEDKVKSFTEKSPIKKGDYHFRWLIEFQIGKKSLNQLSKEYLITRKAVTDGINDVAKLINLSLRVSRGGRKKKSQDSTPRRRTSKR